MTTNTTCSLTLILISYVFIDTFATERGLALAALFRLTYYFQAHLAYEEVVEKLRLRVRLTRTQLLAKRVVILIFQSRWGRYRGLNGQKCRRESTPIELFMVYLHCFIKHFNHVILTSKMIRSLTLYNSRIPRQFNFLLLLHIVACF